MVVSRYLVDVIVIGGLAIGVLGAFYLAQSLFGRTGNYVLRSLLIGLIGGLLVGLIRAISRITQRADYTFMGIDAHTPFVGWVLQLSWWQNAAIGFGAGFVLVSALAYLSLSQPDIASRETILAVGLASAIVWLVTAANLVVSASVSVAQDVFRALGYAAALVTVVAMIWVSSRPPRLTDRQLQLIGLALTLLGFATQFVSPVLDLLNIPVR